MNYQLKKADDSLSIIKKNLKIVINEIKQTESPEFLKETLDKIRLAKEWAKIQQRTEEVYEDLLRIEIQCFKRIYELKCLEVLPTNKRNPAIFFGEKTDEEIENLLKEKPGCSAIKIYKDYTYGEEKERHRQNAFTFASGEYEEDKYIVEMDDIKKESNSLYREYSKDKTSAIAAILDDYASKAESFTIEQFADDLIKETRLENCKIYGHEGFKEGIREVCRKAIMSTKTVFLKDKKTPRFITCFSPDAETHYVRIPFENATLDQFQEMINLRKTQLEQDTKALENLIEIKETLQDMKKDLFDKTLLKEGTRVLIKDILEKSQERPDIT